MIDAFLLTAKRDDLPPPPRWDELDPSRPIVLVTAHRRENHPYMREMCEALRDDRAAPVSVRKSIGRCIRRRTSRRSRTTSWTATPGVVLVDPIDYAAHDGGGRAAARSS